VAALGQTRVTKASWPRVSARARIRVSGLATDHRRVKRRDLERHLRAHGCGVIDEGSNHARWAGPDGMRSVKTRRREIDYRLARKICRDLGIPPPTGAR
jgi:mRNA interferase HicA